MMQNDYRYVDPDHKYTDRNGVLHNVPGIKDEKVLLAFESLMVSKRLEELYGKPIRIKDSSSLPEIHQFLFQDVYTWAGQLRTVNISKKGKPFFEGERFETGFKFIDNLILEYKSIHASDHRRIAKNLSELLDNVNFLHPFREGNGRAQREFIRALALEKGLRLNLNPPDDQSVYERYMQGTIHGDVALLSDLILELIEPLNG